METTHDTELSLACAIARGEAEAPQEPCGEMIAAKKDYNARGRCREHWYRLRWNGVTWEYMTKERLSGGTFYASDRHHTIWEPVYVGDVLAAHDRGGPINQIVLVIGRGEGGKVRFRELEFVKRRDGDLGIKLPDGSQLVTPNPRR